MMKTKLAIACALLSLTCGCAAQVNGTLTYVSTNCPIVTNYFVTTTNQPTYIIRRPMQVVEVDKKCACGGSMRPTNQVLTSNPPQFPHKCTKCGLIEVLRECYPHLACEEVSKH